MVEKQIHGEGGQAYSDRLSPDDQRCLDALDAKLQVLRDRTEGVATGLHTGLHVYGDPGVGKTFTVVQQLARMKVPFRLTNSRVTGRALFDLVAIDPDEILVIDDVEAVTRDVQGASVLRAALGGNGQRNSQGRLERIVTWETHRDKFRVLFTGGIILIGNRPLDDLPELRALKTRISTIHLQASDREIAALMRALALAGHRQADDFLMPAECQDVAEFVISESLRMQRSLNLRDVINGFADYLQWRACDSGCHWHDLILSRLHERPSNRHKIEPDGVRALQKQAEWAIAREIADMPRDDRFREWHARTKKSEPALYRRLRELAKMDEMFCEN